MRTAFINQLTKEAETNDKIFLLVGDLGYNVIETFANKYPDRFRNVGIAEQNMAGIAAGLSMCGFNVYIYSIGNFPTLRCIEQIRNDIAYHNANVKVVAVGGGFAYGDLGATHHATEAIGMMRTIPNIVISSPSDPIEASKITTISSSYKGPMYIQLGKAGEKIIHKSDFELHIGDIIPVRVTGAENAILVTGSISHAVIESCVTSHYDIYTLPFIKPINEEQLIRIGKEYSELFVVEEHQKSGGVGSAIMEKLNEAYVMNRLSVYPKIRSIAINDEFSRVSGTQNHLREINHLYI